MPENERRLRREEYIGKDRHLNAKRHTVSPAGKGRHWHNYYELEIIVEGSGVHILNGEAYPIARGSAYLLSPADFHEMQTDSGVGLWNISFDETVLSDARLRFLSDSLSVRRFRLEEQSLSRVLLLAELLGEECDMPDGCAEALCDALLSFVLRGQGSAPDQGAGEVLRIRKSLLYLDAHFREAPTLSELAAVEGFHPTYYGALFRKITGESVAERLNALRVGYAKGLLSSGFSVSEACDRSGFRSSSHFLKEFKRQIGVSPRDYKRSLK